MSEGVDLATSFGQVAQEYHRWRPGYPVAAIEWVAGQVEGRRALEIGAGTGKATIELLRAGFTVTAVEPDPAMVTVGRSRVPGAEWVVMAAERWSGDEGAFDLVFGAQSWHWVPENTDAPLAAALTAGGAMAWMWNHPDMGQEQDLFGDLYAHYMPEHHESLRVANHRRDGDYWRDRMARLTARVAVFELAWARSLTADEYVALVGTYSDHIALPPHDRTSLQEAIRSRLMKSGGPIEMSYLTRVYLGTMSP